MIVGSGPEKSTLRTCIGWLEPIAHDHILVEGVEIAAIATFSHLYDALERQELRKFMAATH